MVSPSSSSLSPSRSSRSGKGPRHVQPLRVDAAVLRIFRRQTCSTGDRCGARRRRARRRRDAAGHLAHPAGRRRTDHRFQERHNRKKQLLRPPDDRWVERDEASENHAFRWFRDWPHRVRRNPQRRCAGEKPRWRPDRGSVFHGEWSDEDPRCGIRPPRGRETLDCARDLTEPSADNVRRARTTQICDRGRRDD